MKKLGLILISIFLVLVAIHFLISPKSNEFKENDMLEDIQKRGYILVGINPDSKPYGFIDDNGVYAGYDVDLAHYIAKYILKDSSKLKFIPITPSNRLLKATTGEVDIVISTVTITPQREEVVNFSIPYDYAGQALLVRGDSDITSISDLNNRTVGIVFGTTAEKNIKNLIPNSILRGYRSYNDAYNALKAGNIEAITSDDTILNRYAIADSSVKLLSKRYSKEPYGIAFKKGNSSIKFRNEINFILEDIKRKNIINNLRNKWGIE